ncbi:sensor histidine kinase [Egicoccus sp. AB-alg6-2]|uniref:sensor histidine kinase n=1 Tax=Egicoccus sp. AB-alg6-2 TaxID=3242692 RepID=UPI00359EFF97
MRDPAQGLAAGRARSLLVSERTRALAAGLDAEAWLRLAAVATVPIGFALGDQPFGVFEVAALVAYVVSTALVTVTPRLLLLDALVGVALVLALQGQVLPVLAWLLFATIRAGRHAGVPGGVAAGAATGIALAAMLGVNDHLTHIGLGSTLAAAAVFPLAGATTGSLTTLLGPQAARDRVVLQEANRLLSALRSIADHLPGGLDVTTVSAALVAEIRSLTTCTAVMVHVEDAGFLEPTAAAGVGHGTPRRVRLDELRALAATTAASARFHTPQGLPEALRPAAAAARHWTVLALGGTDQLAGVVLIGFDDLDRGRAARPRLASVAADAGIALDNARLFDGTQARAADTARRRLAGDLHDGVAQSLAHLRMELEMRALATDDDPAEMTRLAGLARHTLQELRGTISDLRKPLDGDIDVQIRRHVDRLTSPSAPPIDFTSYGRSPVDPRCVEQVLRVAQEALSNAIRHARADRITVTLERDASLLELVVEDDGVGFTTPSPEAGGGIGLRSMRDRADRLGGTLDVRDRVGGGTVVHLRCPTSPVPSTSGPGRSR